MTIAYVQDTEANSGSVSMGAATGTGSLLVACGRMFSGSYPTAISDSGSNTWTFPATTQTGPPPGVINPTGNPLWIGYVLAAASVTSVTVTESGSALETDVSEFTGVSGVGTSVTNSSSSSGQPTLTGLSYANGDLVVAMAYGNGNSAMPSGWSSFKTSGVNNVSWGYQVMSGSGTLTITWPTSFAAWGAAAIVFTPSGAAAAGLPASGQLVRGRAGRKGKSAGSPAPLVHLEEVPAPPSGRAVTGRRGRRGSAQGSRPPFPAVAAPEDVQAPAAGAAVRGRPGRRGRSQGSPQPLVHVEELPAPSGMAVRGRPGRRGRSAGSQPIPVILHVPEAASGACVRGRTARRGRSAGSGAPAVLYILPLPPAATGKAIAGRRGRRGRAAGSAPITVAAASFVAPQQGTVTIVNEQAASAGIVTALAATVTIAGTLEGSVTIVNTI